VIPTLNRYPYLKKALRDLEHQNYKNFEVIIIDQSDKFDSSFYHQFNLKINVIRQKEKLLWKARNTAIKKSNAKFILLFDDDSRISTDWIYSHLKVLDYFKADISSGVSLSKTGAKIPENYSFIRWSDQLDTGNVLIKKEVFEKIGLFDLQFEKQRMGDGEFGLRAVINGLTNVSNPLAKRIHLKGKKGGLREMGHWDSFRSKHRWSPRPVPSVLYLTRRYFGNKQAFLVLLKTVPSSIIPYRFKSSKIFIVLGSIISIIIFPLVIFQVGKSWLLSNKMLRTGPQIEQL